jgi:energy-coupling factor transporter ATP-binding protein EcfA2
LDRFRLDPDDTFRFMGREIFAKVYQIVSNMSRRTGTIYSLQGTLGSGKSHILAALACLLLKERKRVVYLPDARELAAGIVCYTKVALQLAYADNQALFGRIQGLLSIADIVQFAQERSIQHDRWYLICDQMNALDHFPDTANSLGPDAQMGALRFIQQLAHTHNFIWSASGNCREAASDNARQNSGAKRLLFREGYNRVRSSRFFDTRLTPTNMQG